MYQQRTFSWRNKKTAFYLLYVRYIKDIYSLAVNTINIVIEFNENISILTSAKHE